MAERDVTGAGSREPNPAQPQPMPDEAGDAYVAHATPPLGTRGNRRALLLGAIVVAIAVGLVVWLVVGR